MVARSSPCTGEHFICVFLIKSKVLIILASVILLHLIVPIGTCSVSVSVLHMIISPDIYFILLRIAFNSIAMSLNDISFLFELCVSQCIELYTVEDGEERVGFYSLEMAADLELDPKQYHVIAFEDSGDCKNLCYIIQAKMEMLGNGNAFVVARPPKVIHNIMMFSSVSL